MDIGRDNYTTTQHIQAYLDRDLSTNEVNALGYIIPAVCRWVDRTLGTNFDKLNKDIPFGTTGSGWTQRKFKGGYREIEVTPCQQIITVEAINPYDFSIWYTYTQPLEYTQEPYDYPVKRTLRMRRNEFTGTNLIWPGDLEGIQVTALFTEYDYAKDQYPSDIILLVNHMCAVWLQNNQNAESIQREQVEGHMVMKRIDDLLASDPMVTRVIQSRSDIWLED